MMAIGIGLIIFGIIAFKLLDPPLDRWTWRDIFCAPALIVGVILITCSILVAAWRWLP